MFRGPFFSGHGVYMFNKDLNKMENDLVLPAAAAVK